MINRIFYPYIADAANGRPGLHARRFDALFKFATDFKLRHLWHYTRNGETISGLDDRIYPDFIRDKFQIRSGWNIWLGTYYLAADENSDKIIYQIWNIY